MHESNAPYAAYVCVHACGGHAQPVGQQTKLLCRAAPLTCGLRCHRLPRAWWFTTGHHHHHTQQHGTPPARPPHPSEAA